MSEPRAFYRSYVDNGRRAGQVKRLHVLCDDGKLAGRQGYCGIQATTVTKSEAVILNVIPYTPPDGLTWCGKCVIALARRAMRVAAVDALAAKDANHRYLSTACLHAVEPGHEHLHRECQSDTTRHDGTHKIGASCKWCEAPCVCRCHVSTKDGA